MTAIERTAYPRFKRILSAKDLEEVYTPTPQERFLALRSTKGTVAEAVRALSSHPWFSLAHFSLFNGRTGTDWLTFQS